VTRAPIAAAVHRAPLLRSARQRPRRSTGGRCSLRTRREEHGGRDRHTPAYLSCCRSRRRARQRSWRSSNPGAMRRRRSAPVVHPKRVCPGADLSVPRPFPEQQRAAAWCCCRIPRERAVRHFAVAETAPAARWGCLASVERLVLACRYAGGHFGFKHPTRHRRLRRGQAIGRLARRGTGEHRTTHGLQ
jgi:hypothetical protein